MYAMLLNAAASCFSWGGMRCAVSRAHFGACIAAFGTCTGGIGDPAAAQNCCNCFSPYSNYIDSKLCTSWVAAAVVYMGFSHYVESVQGRHKVM